MVEGMTNNSRVIGGDTNVSAGDARANVNKPRTGPLVEDTSVIGGVDASGAPRIVPRTPDGTVQEDVKPTDPND